MGAEPEKTTYIKGSEGSYPKGQRGRNPVLGGLWQEAKEW